MTIKVLIDMNLSPEWVPLLRDHGWETIHWTTVGDPRASDIAVKLRARRKLTRCLS